MSILSQPYFHNEEAAYEFVESRLWPNGPVCPRCKDGSKISKMQGKSTRIGAYKCYICRKPFTVKVGTLFESSHVKMHLWLQAIFLISSSKKGISSNQLHRTLGVTLKTAWFMSHRIREAMREGNTTGFFNDPGKMGGNGSVVEADETYIGRRRSRKGEKLPTGYGHKEKVMSLVERDGRVRSFHVPAVNAKTVRNVLTEQLHPNTKVYTDDASYYRQTKKFFKRHESVNHSLSEYVRGGVHTNTIENYFSILKRGLNGVYQHCSRQHLKRYLAEFDFRYSERTARGISDQQRAEKLLAGFVGKRLTYQTIG